MGALPELKRYRLDSLLGRCASGDPSRVTLTRLNTFDLT